ncbi:hypothetical protein DFH29DRAFT_948303 [Suillus ampliporus]|nr:hypothetical protein DFH29DRAFT_948303 [Suillus ampliporus]
MSAAALLYINTISPALLLLPLFLLLSHLRTSYLVQPLVRRHSSNPLLHILNLARPTLHCLTTSSHQMPQILKTNYSMHREPGTARR